MVVVAEPKICREREKRKERKEKKRKKERKRESERERPPEPHAVRRFPRSAFMDNEY